MVEKAVRFAEENETFVFDQQSEGRNEELWFSADDYVVIKAKSREEARQWRRRGYGILLKDTFYMPRPDAQEYLNAFTQTEGDPPGRGLERHLSRKHGEERSELKDRSRQSVLIHQRRLQRQGLKPREMTEKIADIYIESCRIAKVFAIRLGKADEYVVFHGEDSRSADKIVDFAECGGGHRRMERRLSNFSVKSANSYDSKRTWAAMGKPPKSRCPSSPASPVDEYYAAIA